MTTEWEQTTNNDYYPMGSHYWWGGQFTDSTFHSLTFSRLQFTINNTGSSTTKTIDLYAFDNDPDATGNTLLESKSFTLAAGNNTIEFDGFSHTFGSSGGYLAIKDDGNLSGFQFREASSSATSTLVQTVQASAVNGEWNVFSNEYPTGLLATSAVTTTGTRLPPPPIVLGGY